MFIHKDVLEAIQSNYFSIIESGAELNQTDLMDLIKVTHELIQKETLALTSTISSFGASYEELRERHLLTSKLFNHFLQLHNLEYEFDNYYERIDRRVRLNKL